MLEAWRNALDQGAFAAADLSSPSFRLRDLLKEAGSQTV
jgi:hypothetical protein